MNATLGLVVRYRLALSVLVACVATAAVQAQWPQFGGPTRDFHAKAGDLSDEWDEDTPQVVWREDVRAGPSSVLFHDDIIYVMDRFNIAEESLYPRNAISGDRLMTLRYPSPISETFDTTFGAGPAATPLWLNGMVHTVGFTGKVQCFHPDSRKVLWYTDLFDVYAATPLKRGYASSPIAYKNSVIFQIGGPVAGLISFETPSANVNWVSPIFQNSYASPILIRVDGQEQIVAMGADRTSAVAPANGNELWTFDHKNGHYSYLSMPVWGDDGLLFLPAGGKGTSHMVKVTHQGGAFDAKQAWSSTTDRLGYGNVIRVGDYLYGAGGNDDASFITAVNAKTGKDAWREKGFGRAAMVYGDGKFIIRDSDGTLALATLTPEKMTVHSRKRLLEPGLPSVPTLVCRKAYIRDDKTVMAVDLR